MAHLILDDDINRLNKLLSEDKIHIGIPRTKKNASAITENVWLVYNKERLLSNKTHKLHHLFKTSPLRIDSLVFVFSEDYQGILSHRSKY